MSACGHVFLCAGCDVVLLALVGWSGGDNDVQQVEMQGRPHSNLRPEVSAQQPKARTVTAHIPSSHLSARSKQHDTAAG